MKKIIMNPWLALITLAVFLSIRFVDFSFVEIVRLKYFDQLIASQPKVDIPVHTVNIDEASLDKFGQWPFPRDYYARIVDDLYARNAGLVVFNVMMPEADRFKQDQILATVLRTQANVVLPAVGVDSKGKNTPARTSVQKVGEDAEGRVVEYPGLLSNVSSLSEVAGGVGVVNTFPEIDGVVRRMPLVILSKGELYPALALETLRLAIQDTRIQVKIGPAGVEALRIPKLNRINTDSLGRVWIDYAQTPKQHSLVDLPKDFKGEIVIVGLSAAGLVNPVATPVGSVWPQDMQAALLGTMLNNSVIQRPDSADTYELVALAIMGILVIFLARWTYGFIPIIIILGASHFVVSAVYEHYKLLFDITLFVIGSSMVYIHAYTVKFLSEYFQKLQIKKQFGSYLSPDLVAKLVKDPSLLKLGGSEQDLTIQFSDVRGFTSISEHYGKDVQGLTKIMNRYMTVMTRVILENEGTLDKYIGDATMSFWNAPLDNTKHAKDSVKAALEMIDAVKIFNEEIAEEGVPPFGLGIGCNTGIVVVGNMGGEQRFDYTCLGDAVNLASRLEGQSKNYGVLIVLGPETTVRVGNAYFTLPLDCIAVKGKTEGVDIATVFYNPPQEQLAEWQHNAEVHGLMLEYYRKQQWDKSVALIETLKGKFAGQMDHYYELWLERIEEMRNAGLPKDWDGIHRATSK